MLGGKREDLGVLESSTVLVGIFVVVRLFTN